MKTMIKVLQVFFVFSMGVQSASVALKVWSGEPFELNLILALLVFLCFREMEKWDQSLDQ